MTNRELNSKKAKLSDIEIIEGIRHDNNEALKFAYEEYFQKVYKYIVKGELLNEEDARDIFHEAILIVYNKVREEKFVLEKNFSAFLFAICKKLVLMRLKLEYNTINNIAIDMDQIPDEEENKMEYYPEIIFDSTIELKYNLYSKYFILLRDDCKKVLTMAFSGASYDEIANVLGYKKGTFAKNKRHRCKEYLTKSIINDRLFKMLKNE